MNFGTDLAFIFADVQITGLPSSGLANWRSQWKTKACIPCGKRELATPEQLSPFSLHHLYIWLSYQCYLSAAYLLAIHLQMQNVDTAGALGIVCIPAIPIA